MKAKLPQYFKPILWEYDFSAMNLEESKKLLISKAINYGDLRHWRWIVKQYGAEDVRRTLMSLATTSIRPPARALAEIVFSLPHINEPTLRGAHR